MVDSNVISHSGRVVEITPDFISVEIISESACASCHAASFCGMGESKTKLVQVPATLGFEVGETVLVNLKRSMGLKAVWVAYVVPLFVLVVLVLVLSAVGLSELLCGLGAIGGVALYYLGVFLLRDRLNNEYSFSIKKL